MLVSAGLNLIVHTWNEDSFDTDVVYTPGEPSKITNVSWCHDNNYLAVLCEKGRPEILAAREKNNIKLVHTISVMSDVSAIAFRHATKRCMGLGTASGQVALYDTRNRSICKLFKNVPTRVKAVDFNAIDNLMAVASEQETIVVYGVADSDAVGECRLPSSTQPTVMRFHVEEQRLLSAGSDSGQIVLWDVSAGKKLYYAQSHMYPVTGIALTPCAKTVISVGEDYQLCVHDVGIKECIYRNSIQHPITAVDLHHDGRTLAVGSGDGSITIYDMRYLIQPVHTATPHDTAVTRLCFENKQPEMAGMQVGSLSELSEKSKATVPSVDGNHFLDADADTESERAAPAAPAERRRRLAGGVKEVKKETTRQLHQHVRDLMLQLEEHMNKLRTFMNNEFAAVATIMDEKLDAENVSDLESTTSEAVTVESAESGGGF